MKKRATVTAAAVVVTLVALCALVAKGCEAVAGGPVGTSEDLRAHVRATTEAGNAVYRTLSPAPAGDPSPVKEGSSSCVDDFGFDDGDVTRSQPVYTWKLDFADGDDYGAAMKALEASWRADGRTVEKVERGIMTTFDDGIQVTFHRGWYSNEPELRAEGRCMRYRNAYGDGSYQYLYDENGDGTVDEYEQPER